MSINGVPVGVAVDVGKNTAVLSVTDAARHRLLGPVEFAMTAPALAVVLRRVCAVLPGTPVGVEAAGHYHRPLLEPGLWPAGWELVELSPARVSEQRRVQGKRRVKTDAIDLEAITDLVLAGHGVAVRSRAAAIVEPTGWAMHRSRRVWTRTATKNQLLAQLDRCFPGVTLALPDVLGTRIGRLVAAEFSDPHRLAALGVTRFVRFAANRGLRVRQSAAERLVAVARTALSVSEAVVARQLLADDLALLADLDAQITAAEGRIATLLPDTPFAVLLTVPGWSVIRAGTTVPRSATRAAGREPARSIGPPGFPPPNMSRLGSVVTAASAERAVCSCGGR